MNYVRTRENKNLVWPPLLVPKLLTSLSTILHLSSPCFLPFMKPVIVAHHACLCVHWRDFETWRTTRRWSTQRLRDWQRTSSDCCSPSRSPGRCIVIMLTLSPCCSRTKLSTIVVVGHVWYCRHSIGTCSTKTYLDVTFDKIPIKFKQL